MEQYVIQGVALIIVALIAWWGGHRQAGAQSDNLNAQTIERLSIQVDGLVEKRILDLKEIQKLREQHDKDRDDIDYVLGRLNVFENAWNEVRRWFQQFKMWADENGYTGYPPIPQSVKLDRDTKDKMKAVK